MRVSTVVRAGSALALAGLAACADQPATSPSELRAPAMTKSFNTEAAVVGHPMLARMNRRLAAAGSKVRVGKAELLYAAKGFNAQTSTEIFANDRTHQLPYDWVPGDPRREGRTGVTYAVDPVLRTTAFGIPNLPAIEMTGGGFRMSTQAELDGYIEEAMQAWRDRRCSDAPIERVAVPARVDPDQLDDLFLGRPSPSQTYAQVADIIHAGWQPPEFFEAITPGGSDAILGITFTFVFTDDAGVNTDIDGNGKLDAGLKEIYYNPSFIYTNRGADGFIDFYSVLAHETGHGLSLAHFGKLFVTKKDAADGIQIEDIKFAPKALMNAAYVNGRDEIRGSDNASFCQIWANR
jgi:hypothetical protein